MNNIFGKSVQIDRKQSTNCSSDASKNTDYFKHSFTESELTERLRILSNNFNTKINKTQVNEQRTGRVDPSTSILHEATQSKLVFGKKEMNSYEKSLTKLNFLQLLGQNEFSLCFQKEKESLISNKGKSFEESSLLWNGLLKKKIEFYNESNHLFTVDSFSLKQNCLISFENIEANPNELSFNIPKEVKNDTRIDSYDEPAAIPLFFNKTRSFALNDTTSKVFCFGKKKTKKKKNIKEKKEDLKKKMRNINSEMNDSLEKVFPCEICLSTFSSPQGLGGHMSRTHKDQSVKFKRKKQIRESRASIRDQREEAKRILCENNNENYDLLINTKEGKGTIKSLINRNMKQFKHIREQLPKKNT